MNVRKRVGKAGVIRSGWLLAWTGPSAGAATL